MQVLNAIKNKGKFPKEVKEIVHTIESQRNMINCITITDDMDEIKKYMVVTYKGTFLSRKMQRFMGRIKF